ncbi:otospiralin-like isoform X2 [Anguilla rostrata]
MPRLCVMLLGCIFLLGLFCLTGAEDAGKGASEEGQAETRDKRSMPNWSLTSSDFFAWVENLRAHAGYDRIEDLARTFWAHFPSANQLGYDTPDSEE